MACDDAVTASDALATALAGPAEVSTDGLAVKQFSLSDLIKADQYQSSKCGVNNPRRGIRFTKLVPPGTV